VKQIFLLLILTILVTFALVACSEAEPGVSVIGGEPAQNAPSAPNNDSPAEPPTGDDSDTDDGSIGDDEPVTPPAFFFKIDDFIVELDSDISYVIAGAGEPIGVLELPSCAFEGMDRVFRYPGADLYTYPNGDNDFVYNIAFFDDSVHTAEGGIRLGASLQAVKDVYGEDYTFDSDMYTFTRGLTVLEFLTQNDIVIGITYRYLVDI